MCLLVFIQTIYNITASEFKNYYKSRRRYIKAI